MQRLRWVSVVGTHGSCVRWVRRLVGSTPLGSCAGGGFVVPHVMRHAVTHVRPRWGPIDDTGCRDGMMNAERVATSPCPAGLTLASHPSNAEDSMGLRVMPAMTRLGMAIVETLCATSPVQTIPMRMKQI